MADVGIHPRGEVNLQILLDKLKKELGRDVGAIGCFVGVVRGLSKEGEPVKFLRYESAENAVEKLREIAMDFERRPNISRVIIHHIVDQLRPGEEIVYIIAAGRGRDEVFKALPEIMDRVKTEVPIWKKEVTERREHWIHELPK